CRGLGRTGRHDPDSKPDFQAALHGEGRAERQSGGDEGKFMKLVMAVLLIGSLALAAKKKAVTPPQSPLDHFVTDARARSAAAPAATPGGIWVPGSRLADAARDLKASQIDDMITILVVETASAVAKGTTKTARTSSAKSSVSALAGVTKAAGPWANLAGLNS